MPPLGTVAQAGKGGDLHSYRLRNGQSVAQPRKQLLVHVSLVHYLHRLSAGALVEQPWLKAEKHEGYSSGYGILLQQFGELIPGYAGQSPGKQDDVRSILPSELKRITRVGGVEKPVRFVAQQRNSQPNGLLVILYNKHSPGLHTCFLPCV